MKSLQSAVLALEKLNVDLTKQTKNSKSAKHSKARLAEFEKRNQVQHVVWSANLSLLGLQFA